MAIHFRDAEALAARAWDVTKAEDEPVFAACASEHRSKLVNVVEDIVERGVGSGIASLERFEEYVRGVMPQDFDGVPAKPSDKFQAEAAKRREEFNAKEAKLLADELDRVDAENEKKAAAKEAEEAKADAKVAAAIAADKSKSAAPKLVAPKLAAPAPKPVEPKPAAHPVKK